MTKTMQYWQHEGQYVGRIENLPETLCWASTLEELEPKVTELYQLVMKMLNPSPAPTVMRKQVEV